MQRSARTRRGRAWSLSLLFLGLTFWALTPRDGMAAGPDGRPNVVLIIADDMNGYGFHHELRGLKVPHLDALKRRSVTFDHAYATAPSCVPSRASFLSGLHPHTTGSYLNGSDPWKKSPMADVDSLPELFKRSGYRTWGGGKLFHAQVSEERERGAWHNAPVRGGGFGPFLLEKDQLAGQWWGAGPWTGPDSDFPDVVNTDAAVTFLREVQGPFFLALGLWRPHTPFTAPRRFFDQYKLSKVPFRPRGYREADLADVPPAGQHLAAVWGDRFRKTGKDHPDLWRRILWGYMATTSFADWNVGRLIAALDAGPHGRDTLVIFFSDNGYHCGEKDHFEKSTLWEASARVPLAIRLPGGRNGGRRTLGTVTLADLYPTLVDYCRLEAPRQTLEGRSLRPLLDRPDAPWDRPAITEYEEGFFSARDRRYRYIRYPDGTEELYDHKHDPHEFHNLAAHPQHRAAKERLRREIPARWAPSLGGREG